MLGKIIKYGLVLVAGILIYNLFFGDASEKKQAKEVIGKAGDALGATWNLLKSEKQKFDAGKYDQALDKLSGAYQAIRNGAQYLDQNVLRRLDELERRKAGLQQQLDSIEADDQALQNAPPPPKKKGLRASAADDAAAKAAEQQRRKEALQRELEQLIRDSDALLKQAQDQ
ncbi:MAG: hypothetical protein JNJ90_10665 [Saprospiraceae bacterium]|jgi:hypothetical protein|nr:hypothetical protein [Saprospiraceae bacterium]